MPLDATIKRYLQSTPQTKAAAFVHPTAILIGDVFLDQESSIWPLCVLRADINKIHIGAQSNIQDATVIHLADDFPTIVGAGVTVGHRSILHACKIEDNCLIGMGATILDGAHIGFGSIIGAGALVPKNMRVPPRSLVLGLPAKVVRPTTEEEFSAIIQSAKKYVALAKAHSQD